MKQYLILGGVIITLAGTAWFYRSQYRSTAEKLDIAEAQIEGYEEAARIHRKYLERLQEQNQRADDLDRELQELEGGDAPLSDYLGRAAGRLWP